jgi:hypothetical protein
MLTDSWAKVCKPFNEGGLGIRNLVKLNEASNLKLCRNFFHSTEQWAVFLRCRVCRNSKVINHHIFSSIWSGIKGYYSVIMENSSWLLGNGDNINFWLDHWCGEPIAKSLDIPIYLQHHLSSTVNQFLVNNHWLIPPIILNNYPQLANIISRVSIPIEPKPDELLWNNSTSGSLSLKDAYLFKDPIGQNIHWSKIVWNISIPWWHLH